MKRVLSRFVAWSREHAGMPCPSVATLGVPADDPWGHPLRITCTDQPGDQSVGLISAGPDGASGTTDDIASWQLGREVTDIVRGSRWIPTPVARPAPSKPVTNGTKKLPADTTTKPKKPIPLDENGLPITR